MSTVAPPRPAAPVLPPLRPSRVRAVAAIVTTALRRIARDRIALFFIVVLPFLVILLFGSGGGQGAMLPAGVTADDGAAAAEVVAALEAADAITLREHGDAEALGRAVRRDDLVGGVVVTSEPGADGGADVRWIADPGATSGLAARVAVESALAGLDARLTAVRVVVDELGADPVAARAAADRVDAAPLLDVVVEDSGGESFSFGIDESAQHNLVLFVFITSLTGGAVLIESRRLGTIQRALATPTSPATVLLGEAAARFAIALAQALLVLVGASVLFGASWGDPLAVAAVVGVFCLVGTGAAMLFGAALSSTEQATAIAAPLGIGLGMLGGALWPIEVVPPVMQTISRAVPHSWAIAGLREIGNGGGLGDVLVPLAVLGGFAAVLLLIAVRRLGRTLGR